MRSIAALLFVIGLIIGLAGCAESERGETGAQGVPGNAGTGCTTRVATVDEAPAGGGVVVTCGPYSSFIANGRNGVDASGVTVVKLCQGETVYPTTFVEVAFCVSGRLYGTYSTNGGFSTELPPGAYTSNAVGSRCDFTVLPNCTVVN